MEEFQTTILKIVNESIEGNEITSKEIGVDLLSYGMDSIAFIRIIVSLEEVYNVEIPDEYLLATEMNTVEKLIKVISLILERKIE